MRSSIPVMRPFILSCASFILSIAFQLTLAKYGTEVPDGWILVLWVLPLAFLRAHTDDELLTERLARQLERILLRRTDRLVRETGFR